MPLNYYGRPYTPYLAGNLAQFGSGAGVGVNDIGRISQEDYGLPSWVNNNYLPALQQDFLDNNWDVLYEAMLPQQAAAPFTNFLRQSSNRYQNQYLGALGRQSLAGNVPDYSSRLFLARLFGGGPTGLPGA